MSKAKLAVLLCNLGTPSEPTPSAVRAFLKPFLSDPRVVEVPRPVWWIILNAFILPFRPKPVSEGYKALWDEYGDSPLRLITQEQVAKLSKRFSSSQETGEILFDYAFSYGAPALANQLEKYHGLAEKILLLPLYPQYSCSTTASIYDQVARYNLKQRDVADTLIIKHYYNHPLYRQALVASVKSFWEESGKGDHLLVSYHGVPKSYADKGDPYYHQCLETSSNLKSDLNIEDTDMSTSFQSRLGKAEWLKPYTDATVRELAKKGIKTLDVICPSFSVDCLETLEEITEENGHYFTEAGGEKLRLIPCLNALDVHIDMMESLVKPYMNVVND